jgi:GxxExxY protein
MRSESKTTVEIAEGGETLSPSRGSVPVENALTEKIIGAAIEVHRHLGPGLLESVYEECLCYELRQLGIQFERQVYLPITYKGLKLESAYKMDLVVENAIVVEIKATEGTAPIHHSQLLTYLKSANKRIGLLINFNVPILKNGLKRVVNHYTGPSLANSVSAPSAFKPEERTTPESLSETPRLPPRLRVSASRNPTASRNPGASKDPRPPKDPR